MQINRRRAKTRPNLHLLIDVGGNRSLRIQCHPASSSRKPVIHRSYIYFPWLRRGGLALIGLFAWSMSVGPAVAADTTAFNLPQMIEIAQRDNKDLQAARYAIAVGRARLVQAGLRPNPRLAVSGISDFAFSNEGDYGSSVGISQQFPIAGRILRQKDVARVDIALAQAEVAEAERQLAGVVTAEVYRLLVIDRQIQSRSELISVEEKLAKATRDRMRAAEVSELDVNTVKLDLQRLAQERSFLHSQRLSLLVTLNTLIGKPAYAPLAINEHLPEADTLPSQKQLLTRAFQVRPDLRSARLIADRAQAEKALARAQRWEDWNLGLGINQDRLAIEGAPSQAIDRTIGFSLTIPLPLFNKNQGLIAEAQANADRSRVRIEALRLTIASEIASAHTEAENLQQLVAQYREGLLPVSARNVQLAQQGYRRGQISIIEVVQAQRQLADLDVAYLNTLDQFLQVLARLRTAAADYNPVVPPSSAANDVKKEY